MQKTVKITNKGMVSIPANLRKKFNLKDGDYVIIDENENGTMQITPIIPLDKLKMQSATVEEFREVYHKAKEEELNLEF
jgi:AbrB family looped-hinge helix DNA binding protein